MSFKDFKIIETIGKGSFASVYKVIIRAISTAEMIADILTTLYRLFVGRITRCTLSRE
jgi:hypothetical protein